MAERKLVVQIVGDDESLRRAFTRSSGASRKFGGDVRGAERDLSRFTRGALAGSGVFHSLGRSVAFASGGFLAFASAGQFLRTSIDAAREAEVTQRQLATQLRNSDKAFKDYRGEIDQTNLRLSAMSGFNKDELDVSLTTILRTTGDVSKALRDNALAADIARARHIGLAQAALVIAKTEAGNTTLLRRQGFQISKNATAEQALAKVRQVVAGQARAGATEAERFGAVLHDTEVIIGTGLLPTLNKYLVSGTHWLAQMNESGQLQRDVAKASDTLGAAVSGIRAALSPVVTGFRLLGRVTGGTKNAVELLGTAFVVLEARSKLVQWGLITTAEREVGAAATTSAGEVDALGASLGRLRLLGPIAIQIVADFIPNAPKDPSRFQKGPGPDVTHLPLGFGKAVDYGRFIGDKIGNAVADGMDAAGIPNHAARVAQRIADATANFVTSAYSGPGARNINPFSPVGSLSGLQRLMTPDLTAPPQRTGRLRTSLQGRFNVDELRLANAQLTRTAADDRRILRDEAAITREQIAGTKNLKDKTTLTNQLVGIMGQLKGLAKAASDAFTLPQKFDLATARAAVTASTLDDLTAARARQAAISAAVQSGRLHGAKLIDALNQLASVNDQITSAEQTALQKAQEAAQRRTQRLSARQFRALGLDATGSPLTPGVKALRRELGTVDQAITGTFLDTSKTQSVLSRIRRVLSGGLGAVTKDVRSQVKQMLDDLDQQLKDHAGGPQTKFRAVSTKSILAGLGIVDPAQIRRDRAILSQIGRGNTVPIGSVASRSIDTTVIHAHVHIGEREIGTAVTRFQQKRDRRDPPQKRGPFARGT